MPGFSGGGEDRLHCGRCHLGRDYPISSADHDLRLLVGPGFHYRSGVLEHPVLYTGTSPEP